ncbi:tetratricopeptide repeat protein [Polynucleobacter sp. CS-Odin-A6]|uniref:tetratricopeptide repeat protein n=1 Tax=Polynucleobacter sp. CS-Odin-A6 TaxID=2689106 RepID=UPI001C0CAB47|nr:tetratricopeptide repeat protein [Polynucleobacter sp. CS-Odin-A6]MBU3621817.1 tetratricopeptide repeat protein [Polynucleobacter sp. CS-Odin-A6]
MLESTGLIALFHPMPLNLTEVPLNRGSKYCLTYKLLQLLHGTVLLCFLGASPASAYVTPQPVESLLLKGDTKAALAQTESMKKDLSPIDYANTKATALLMLGRWQDAANLLEPYYEKDRTNLLVANNYAVALWGMDKKDQARKVLETALNTSSPAYRSLRKIYSAQAAEAYAKALNEKNSAPAPILLAASSSGADLVDKPVVVAQAPKAPPPAPASTSAPTQVANVQAPKTSPVATPVVEAPAATVAAVEKDATPSPQELETINANMSDWVKAWSSKNVKSYLAFYSPSFSPDKGLSYSDWLEQRKQRVAKPGAINVEISVMKVVKSKGKIVVTFRQKYNSANVNTNSVKALEWVNDKGTWLIVREFNK